MDWKDSVKVGGGCTIFQALFQEPYWHLREGCDRAVRSVSYGTDLGRGTTSMQEGKETLSEYFPVVSMVQKMLLSVLVHTTALMTLIFQQVGG